MQYDREKYERLEERSIELLATSNRINELLTEAIHREIEARHVLSKNFESHLPHKLLGERFNGTKPMMDQVMSQYDAGPDDFRQALARTGADTFLLNLLDQHQAAVRELERVKRRQAEHQAKQAAFMPAFARCSQFVRRLSGVHGEGVSAEGTAIGDVNFHGISATRSR